MTPDTHNGRSLNTFFECNPCDVFSNIGWKSFHTPSTTLTEFLITFATSISPKLYAIYTLAVLIPNLAVSVRRLHDVGKSGWMCFIALIPLIGAIWLLVLMLTDSNSGENEYGANPKEII